MVSNEPKDDKIIKGWEEIGQINTNNSDNSQSSISNQESQNEQAELSEVEIGNKGQPDLMK